MRRRNDYSCMSQHLISCQSVVPAPISASSGGARRGQGFEAKARENTCRADVPWIGNDKDAEIVMKRAEADCLLVLGHAVSPFIHPTLALFSLHDVSHAHPASFCAIGMSLRPPAILNTSRHESSSSGSIERRAARFRSPENRSTVRFWPVGAAFGLGGRARRTAAGLFERPSPGRAA